MVKGTYQVTKDSKISGAERREHFRAPIMLKVSYRNASDFLAAYTENVSSGGLFIATDEQIEKGTKLDFEISFPGLLDPIPLTGIVKWCRPDVSQEGPAGIGIQFLDIDPKTSKNNPLATLVERIDPQKEERTPQTSKSVFRVMLIEDNVVVRDMFRYGIQKLNRQKKLPVAQIEVEEVNNGKEAWDLLNKKTFHLLVLDLYMPVMDGTQLIEHVRNNPAYKTIPIIVVSAGGQDDRKHAIEAGADIFLSKPIKLKEMLETVETLISSGHGSTNT
jgi:uncharacterized protein (TIGR02266 family)